MRNCNNSSERSHRHNDLDFEGRDNVRPYTEAQVRELFAAGNLVREDVAWREGDTETRRLGDLLGIPDPPELKEIIYFNENGIFVSSKRIVIGSQTFALRNVGGVSVEPDGRRRLVPALGFV